MKIATAAQMREMDRQTIEDFHLPGILLMERGALAVVSAMRQKFGNLEGKKVAVICGKGNNGGDGFAVARLLSSEVGTGLKIWLACEPSRLLGDAAKNYETAKAFSFAFGNMIDADFSDTDIIIDALFGTGMKGEPEGSDSVIIHAINDSGKPVVSIDVPSGLNVDTGIAAGAVIRATLTVTFSLVKFGLVEYPGCDYTGELIVADIGIPNQVMAAPGINTFVTEISDIADSFPCRNNGRDANKGTFGHVAVLSGSNNVAGAPIMVAEAASRTGAGLVTLAIPSCIKTAVMSRVSPVIMTLALPESRDGSFDQSSLEISLALNLNANAVVLGPGIGLMEDTLAFVLGLIENCSQPLVIDADALTLISRTPERGALKLRQRTSPTILTPHPGEMARLLGITTEAVQADRKSAVMLAAKTFGCTVLLKGARTLIASKDGTLYVNPTGNPGMATGGTGDVLSGVIGALLAQHLEPLFAAIVGTYIHGLAGDLASVAQGGPAGLIATDVISHLPRAIALCQSPIKNGNIFSKNTFPPERLNHSNFIH